MGSAVEFTKEYDEYLLILEMSTSAVAVKRVPLYMKLIILIKQREWPEQNIQLFSSTITLLKQRIFCQITILNRLVKLGFPLDWTFSRLWKCPLFFTQGFKEKFKSTLIHVFHYCLLSKRVYNWQVRLPLISFLPSEIMQCWNPGLPLFCSHWRELYDLSNKDRSSILTEHRYSGHTSHRNAQINNEENIN